MLGGNRQEMRVAFAALLETALVTDNALCQDVFSYPLTDFAGHSPVTTVQSGGSMHEQYAPGSEDVGANLYINTYIAYAPAPDPNWTDEDVEERLDSIDAVIGHVIRDNQNSSYWTALTQTGESQTTFVVIGGVEYRREQVVVQVT